ncbi:hypothetical protein [Evansella clarkii]|uniref:hypothetical protein n=1 Tax=Evansella clarkii TaxID=79879 RepID=UPI000B4446A9|nr:hypothetical protein [Evansella clarkii]
MGNIVIYYRLSKNESTLDAVSNVNSVTEKLNLHYTIKGVFMDDHHSNEQLTELFDKKLISIKYLFINKPIEDEFDYKMLQELAKAESFDVKYFSEL